MGRTTGILLSFFIYMALQVSVAKSKGAIAQESKDLSSVLRRSGGSASHQRAIEMELFELDLSNCRTDAHSVYSCDAGSRGTMKMSA